MLEEEKLKKEEAESLKKEKDVQDEEMVEFYSSVASTISKKFANKRNSAGDTLSQPRDELTLCQISKKYIKRFKKIFPLHLQILP